MDYSAFKFKAVVDWIEVQIQTTATTNFQSVKRAFLKATGINSHVTPVSPNDGGGTCHFCVRIHDVERHSDIEKMLLQVGAKLSLTQGFKINKIEVALDAYCDDPATQAARFYKFMTHPISDNRRMYHEHAGTVKAMPRTIEAITRHMSEGWQIGIGNKTDDRYQHIYFKTTDTHQGERQEVEHRARIEVRFSGPALPCQTHDAWQQFKFETLAQYFRFMKLKDDLEPLIQTTTEALDQIGERKTRKRVHEGRESGTRLHSRATQADTVLNSKARDALRKLSARWASDAKRGRQTRTTAATCCGNTGGSNEPNPYECREEAINSNDYIYQQEQQDKVTATASQLTQDETSQRTPSLSPVSAPPLQPVTTQGSADDQHNHDDATLATVAKPPRPP